MDMIHNYSTNTMWLDIKREININLILHNVITRASQDEGKTKAVCVDLINTLVPSRPTRASS